MLLELRSMLHPSLVPRPRPPVRKRVLWHFLGWAELTITYNHVQVSLDTLANTWRARSFVLRGHMLYVTLSDLIGWPKNKTAESAQARTLTRPFLSESGKIHNMSWEMKVKWSVVVPLTKYICATEIVRMTECENRVQCTVVYIVYIV